jgi:hypothetical protein
MSWEAIDPGRIVEKRSSGGRGRSAVTCMHSTPSNLHEHEHEHEAMPVSLPGYVRAGRQAGVYKESRHESDGKFFGKQPTLRCHPPDGRIGQFWEG